MKLVSVTQMRAIESEANGLGYTYEQMMERAGHGVAQVVRGLFDEDKKEKVVIGLVGPGNNGGDTLVALASLAQSGWEARAYLAKPRPANDQLLKRLLEAGGKILLSEQDNSLEALDAWLSSSTVLLDGLLGTGIQLPLKPELARLLGHVARSERLPYVIAVDCPSGVDCESGAAAEECIPADLTVCIEAVKAGLLRFPAFSFVGKLKVVPLDLPEGLASAQTFAGEVITSETVKAILPRRPIDAHKGTFGTALIVAGSINYTGAVYLAGAAAYRVGAGLVQMAVPGPLHPALAGQFPEATWLILPHATGVIAAGAEDLLALNLDRATAMLIGPGLGREDTTAEFLQRLLGNQANRPGKGAIGFLAAPRKVEEPSGQFHLPPLVIDADALTLLSRLPDWPKLLPSSTVLTPHPGEMSRLCGLTTEEIQANRLEIARRFASQWGHIVVLKGALTVIANPTGDARVIPVASPALARAGTGDVLAGMITGLIAQGVLPFEAAIAGAWLHAQAGLQAATQVGHAASVLAHDVLNAVPEVLKNL